MCAIAGILDLPVTDTVKSKMLATMLRRGPDANGSWQEKGCTLLHARLAVIDPEGGKQPMTLDWGKDSYVMIYNGELYNTWELRQELLDLGHAFEGHSDTEVLLHSYAQWGENCLDRLNGIFAFAVWERNNERLFLARDRIGVKPLFFKLHAGGLLFSSELKTILTYPTVKHELDAQGAAEIILLGPGRTPGCGVFRGVEELKPGYCGYWKKGKFTQRCYWKLKDREHRESFHETAETVRQLVLDTVRRQMVSDVPIGTFLSGGLDSSLISAICAQEMTKQGKQLATFSVDYVDNDKYFSPSKFQPNSDSHYIRLMQEYLDTDHHWCVLTPEELVQELESATQARDLPGMADVDFSLLAFCRQIRQSVTVALSGECADEIFGGYPWYRDPQVRDADGFPWAQNTLQRCQLLRPELMTLSQGEAYVRSRYEQTCQESDILPDRTPEEKRMKQMINLNMHWFMQTLLDRKDRMSMYSALEVRVPFCDYRIAEYLYGVPWEYKDHQGKEKGLLRCAMDGLLPEEVLWRKKSPYPKTHDPKYTALVHRRMNQLLEEKDAPLFSLVKKENVRQLLEQSSPWPWYGQLMTGPQTIAYLLQVDHWLRYYNIDIV